MHDDIIVKDWSFINICLQSLSQGFAFVGNGMNYPASYDPTQIVRGKKAIDWVKESSKPIFNTAEQNVLTLRESFICTMRGYLRAVFDFEVIWEEPKPDAEGKIIS